MLELFVKTGARYRRAKPAEVCERASAYTFESASKDRPTIGNPTEARAFLMHQAGLEREQFGLVYLDNRHRVLSVEILFTGTIDGASVHPRECVKGCLNHGAAAVILFHNHPSGNPSPSRADEMITHRLKDALALIDVRLIDHLIIASTDCVSLAKEGVI